MIKAQKLWRPGSAVAMGDRIPWRLPVDGGPPWV